MQVKVATSLRHIDCFDIQACDLRTILNHIKFLKGSEYSTALMQGKFKYILVDSTENLEPVGLIPEVIFGEFPDYDTLYIIHELCGEGTAIVLAITGAASVAALSTAGLIAVFVINVVISIAVSFLISLLSPTPEFSSDPSQAQLKQSSLFNGAPLIREQGGSVPLVFGNPFAGGVLISSGVSTEDVI